MSITAYTEGNYPTYRFYISTEPSSLCCEVFPLNFNATSLVDTKQDNQSFYRRVFSGTLLFGTNSTAIDVDGNVQNRTDDWDMFWGFEQDDPCAIRYLIITKTVSGDVEIYWDGVFSTTNGLFDIDRCTFEVTPLANDDYTALFVNADIQYNILSTGYTFITTRAIQGTMDNTYTRNLWLARLSENNILEYLADKILTGVTVSSDFFTDATNPVTLHANHLLYLTIAQKSDIIRPADSNPASTAMLSWNELMDILWAMFQVQWDYDPDTDTINVEHISWWSAAAGMDLRTQLSTVATNKYSYLKEKMPKYEKFTFMEADNDNFQGWPIYYDSACVDPNPDTNVRELAIPVTTDIEYIDLNPAAISDDGFVILCNYFDTPDYFVDLDLGEFHADVRANMHLSWANLQNCYFRHNRVLITGYLNGSLVTFWTAQKTKHQECSAITCDEFDPSEEVTTELGETYFDGAKAQVQRSELSPSGLIKFNLLYGPADNEPTEIADAKWILVYEGDCGEFTATLSEAAGGNIDLLIKFVVFDSDGLEVCDDSTGETFTIETGKTTDTYNITFANCVGGAAALAAGGCIFYYSVTTSTGDWTVSWIVNPECQC